MTFNTRLAFAFLVQSVCPPLLIRSPRLSHFVNCFRLTDRWMNRSIDLMHMYRYYTYLRFISVASSSFCPLHPSIVFSFSRIFVPPCSRRSSEASRNRAKSRWEIETENVFARDSRAGRRIRKSRRNDRTGKMAASRRDVMRRRRTLRRHRRRRRTSDFSD